MKWLVGLFVWGVVAFVVCDFVGRFFRVGSGDEDDGSW